MLRMTIALAALAAVMVLIATPASAAPSLDSPITVQVALLQQSIRVGDQVPLRVTVLHQNQTVISFPDLTGTVEQIEVIRRQQLPSSRNLDRSEQSTMEYTITAFAPGSYPLPPISVHYTLPDGSQGSVQATDQLTLEVLRLVANPDRETLRDIKAPIALPRPAIAYLRPAATATLLVGIAGLALILLRRLARRVRGVLPLPVLDPEAAARAELGRLAALELVTEADYARFYSGVSTCIRRYLDARFGLDAMASTTNELRRRLERDALDQWQARIVMDLLRECDAVKWAHYRPDPARAERTLTNALETIDLTRPSAPSELSPATVSARALPLRGGRA